MVELFKDFFDYEYWDSRYLDEGRPKNTGKWWIINSRGAIGETPAMRTNLHITSENPITASELMPNLDSARFEVYCDDPVTVCFAKTSWLPGAYPNGFPTLHFRLRLRIDTFDLTTPLDFTDYGSVLATIYRIDTTKVLARLSILGNAPPFATGPYLELTWLDSAGLQNKVVGPNLKVGVEYTVEIRRVQGATSTDGEIIVYLNDTPVIQVTGVNTSADGSSQIELGQPAGSVALGGGLVVFTVDDVRAEDQFIGQAPFAPFPQNLIVQSSPEQNFSVKIGNHVVGNTPITVSVPDGTLPKVGMPQAGFDRLTWAGVDMTAELWDTLISNRAPDTPHVETETIAVFYYPLPTVTLTINSAIGGTTTPSPGDYTFDLTDPPQTTRVTAIPDATYSFDHWELDGIGAGSINPISVTMDTSHTLNPVFLLMPTFTVNVEALFVATPISVSVIFDGSPVGNTPIPISSVYEGNHIIQVQSEVTVDMTKLVFDHWSDGNLDNPRTDYIAADSFLTAIFVEAPQYVLTISVTAGGTTNPLAGPYSYDPNTSIVVTAYPNSGYLLDHWELDGINFGSANPITVTMNADHSLLAVFATIEAPPPPCPFHAAYMPQLFHPDLLALRKLRDMFIPRKLVEIYYSYSPLLTPLLLNREKRKLLVRLLLKPIVRLAKCLCKQ